MAAGAGLHAVSGEQGDANDAETRGMRRVDAASTPTRWTSLSAPSHFGDPPTLMHRLRQGNRKSSKDTGAVTTAKRRADDSIEPTEKPTTKRRKRHRAKPAADYTAKRTMIMRRYEDAALREGHKAGSPGYLASVNDLPRKRSSILTGQHSRDDCVAHLMLRPEGKAKRKAAGIIGQAMFAHNYTFSRREGVALGPGCFDVGQSTASCASCNQVKRALSGAQMAVFFAKVAEEVDINAVADSLVSAPVPPAYTLAYLDKTYIWQWAEHKMYISSAQRDPWKKGDATSQDHYDAANKRYVGDGRVKDPSGLILPLILMEMDRIDFGDAYSKDRFRFSSRRSTR